MTKELISLNIMPNTTENIEYFTDALVENKTLKSLTIESLHLPNLDSFVKVLDFNTTLQRLSLPYNKIKNVGQNFTNALEFNITLQELSLSNNNIKDINLLFKAVFRNIYLTSLELSYCKIKEISNLDDLKTNKSLKRLNLIDNKIKNVGAFMEALTYNTCLTNLNLKIYEDADLELVENMLRRNTSLINFNYEIERYDEFSLSTRSQQIRQSIHFIYTRLHQNRINNNNRKCALSDLLINNGVL